MALETIELEKRIVDGISDWKYFNRFTEVRINTTREREEERGERERRERGRGREREREGGGKRREREGEKGEDKVEVKGIVKCTKCSRFL